MSRSALLQVISSTWFGSSGRLSDGAWCLSAARKAKLVPNYTPLVFDDDRVAFGRRNSRGDDHCGSNASSWRRYAAPPPAQTTTSADLILTHQVGGGVSFQEGDNSVYMYACKLAQRLHLEARGSRFRDEAQFFLHFILVVLEKRRLSGWRNWRVGGRVEVPPLTSWHVSCRW